MNMHLANLALVPQRMQLLLLQRQHREAEERAQRQRQADMNMIGAGELGPQGIWQVWNLDNVGQDEEERAAGGKPARSKSAKLVCSILDLVYLIISYADDESLCKLSQVDSSFRSILFEEP